MSDPFSSSTMSPERKLWCSVLMAMANDLVNGSPFSKARADAVSWVGTFPSKNFEMVCELAGFEPDALHPIMLKLSQLSEEKRIKYGSSRLKLMDYFKSTGRDIA